MTYFLHPLSEHTQFLVGKKLQLSAPSIWCWTHGYVASSQLGEIETYSRSPGSDHLPYSARVLPRPKDLKHIFLSVDFLLRMPQCFPLYAEWMLPSPPRFKKPEFHTWQFTSYYAHLIDRDSEAYRSWVVSSDSHNWYLRVGVSNSLVYCAFSFL